jgi:N-methylhydantoinase B
MTAFFYCVDPTVPHNEGSAGRVQTVLREGSVAGIPRYPVGTSVCTTYNFDRVVSAVLHALTKMDPEKGYSEPAVVDACISVTSGADFRRNNAFYAHEVFKGGSAGPASEGVDGWVGWGAPCGSGAQYWESVEIHELRYPHIWWTYESENGTCPAGKWVSGPRTRFVLAPRESTMMVASFGDGRVFKPRGVLKGQDGPGADSYLVEIPSGKRIQQLPLVCMQPVEKGQGWECCHGTAAAFGDPLERDPELVRRHAREGLITLEQAREDYGVILNTEPEEFSVDEEGTESLRKKRRARGENT